jgi:hypothetical protein
LTLCTLNPIPFFVFGRLTVKAGISNRVESGANNAATRGIFEVLSSQRSVLDFERCGRCLDEASLLVG